MLFFYFLFIPWFASMEDRNAKHHLGTGLDRLSLPPPLTSLNLSQFCSFYLPCSLRAFYPSLVFSRDLGPKPVTRSLLVHRAQQNQATSTISESWDSDWVPKPCRPVLISSTAKVVDENTKNITFTFSHLWTCFRTPDGWGGGLIHQALAAATIVAPWLVTWSPWNRVLKKIKQ